MDAELIVKLRSIQDSLNDAERRDMIKQRIKRVVAGETFSLGIGARGDEGRCADESAAATAAGEFAEAL